MGVFIYNFAQEIHKYSYGLVPLNKDSYDRQIQVFRPNERTDK